MYMSYSINISRRANARVKVSLYTHITSIYVYTVEGVCSRLIVDYLCGTCEVNGKGFYASLSYHCH